LNYQKYKTKLKELNLPAYSFRITGKEGLEMIFDPVRKKHVRLTPEEWVRQNFIQYLIREGHYPASLIIVEGFFRYNKMKKRADIIVHNRKGEPILIVECKSTEIVIDDTVKDQLGEYNMEFRVPYVVITNGLRHYAFRYDSVNNCYDYLMAIPLYEDLLT
jgi:hypothetical protein